MLRMVLEEFLQGNGSEPITREIIITALKSASVELPLIAQEMKGTKVQTLGASAVAGAWTVHGWLIGQ